MLVVEHDLAGVELPVVERGLSPSSAGRVFRQRPLGGKTLAVSVRDNQRGGAGGQEVVPLLQRCERNRPLMHIKAVSTTAWQVSCRLRGGSNEQQRVVNQKRTSCGRAATSRCAAAALRR